MRSSKLFPFDGHDKPERELEMRILVTGAGGMLGSAFLAHSGGHSLFGVGRAALDPRDRAAVDGLAAAHRAEVLVNCAADTDVEGAEAHPERTFAANAELPGLLAAGCQRAGALMVQISSTGCYGAWKETPYCEDDPLRPTTVYHRTKAAGEAAVTKQATDWLILRVGWLYGGAGSNPKNFVARRLEEAARSRPVPTTWCAKRCCWSSGALLAFSTAWRRAMPREPIMCARSSRRRTFPALSGTRHRVTSIGARRSRATRRQ
jgi:nucleoside-diphosphate-sugar epimerase